MCEEGELVAGSKSGPAAESSRPPAASDSWSRLLSTSVLGCISLISSLGSEAGLRRAVTPPWRRRRLGGGGTAAGGQRRWAAHSNAAIWE